MVVAAWRGTCLTHEWLCRSGGWIRHSIISTAANDDQFAPAYRHKLDVAVVASVDHPRCGRRGGAALANTKRSPRRGNLSTHHTGL